jgi:2-polyprenyl-3-methyl-5-hydroxy-6-metoxy-1,4-benzoquinol methylase
MSSDIDFYYETNYRPHLPNDRNAAILDLGCGQGNFVRFLHRLGYRKITAVDFRQEAIAALQDLDGVTAVCAHVDSDFLRRLDQDWELIVAKQMLYYFDPREAPEIVRAMGAKLAANGTLIIEVFNGALLSSRFTELKETEIVAAYSENSLGRLVAQSGLHLQSMVGGRNVRPGARGMIYQFAQGIWFRIYRALIILEQGLDDELPRIRQKSIIAVATRRQT